MERPPREQCCCFTGHRQAHFPFRDARESGFALFAMALQEAVGNAIRAGYTHFLSGMCEGMDLWGAEMVLRYREVCPAVTLEAVVPFLGQERYWNAEDQQYYYELLDKAQMVTVLEQSYHRGSYHARNRFMVDHASLVIAAYQGGGGGTGYTVGYAEKHGIPVCNIMEYYPKQVYEEK